jgi:tryptophan aminotransferase
MSHWFFSRFKLLLNSEGTGDAKKVIQENALRAGVIVLPGLVAYPNERESSYCRASFSIATDEQLDEAARRLATVVREARKSAGVN